MTDIRAIGGLFITVKKHGYVHLLNSISYLYVLFLCMLNGLVPGINVMKELIKISENILLKGDEMIVYLRMINYIENNGW